MPKFITAEVATVANNTEESVLEIAVSDEIESVPDVAKASDTASENAKGPRPEIVLQIGD